MKPILCEMQNSRRLTSLMSNKSLINKSDKQLKGSVQHCVQSEIDVSRIAALEAFKSVIHIRFGEWSKDVFCMIIWISQHYLSIKHRYVIIGHFAILFGESCQALQLCTSQQRILINLQMLSFVKAVIHYIQLLIIKLLICRLIRHSC